MPSTQTRDSTEPRRVKVALGERSYDVLIGTELLEGLADALDGLVGSGERLGVVVSTAVARHHGAALRAALSRREGPLTWIELPDGEEAKDLSSLERIWDAMLNDGISRQSAVLAFGGGVVGDIAGFAAASLLRGIQFIQVPTTLLAMVDSSVGGKTGINHSTGKNLLGAFHQPSLVLADLDLLATLPREEMAAGLAEVIKYGIIWDADFFAWLEENIEGLLRGSMSLLAHAVERSVAIKAEVVANDERESGLRAILNFGHTIGHAIENATGYGKWRHGEAIAAGMVAEARLARRAGLLDSDESVDRIATLCNRLGLPVDIPRLPLSDLVAPMQKDKKVRDGRVRFVLPDRIGCVRMVDNIPSESVEAILRECMAGA